VSFFAKLKEGLQKTRNNFSEKLEQLFTTNPKLDNNFLESLEETLITSDVGYETTENIINDLKKLSKDKNNQEKDVKELLKETLKERLQHSLEIDELLMGKKPAIILIVGVNGVGKTTTIGKLSHQFKGEGKKVMMVAGDTFRAAAIEQLEIWSERAKVDFVKHNQGANPGAVVFDGIQSAKAKGTEIILCDTAGRLHNKKNLMDELSKIKRVIERELPESKIITLLVLDATTGQNAISQAKVFNEVADLTGLVITKLDGTAKGGIIFALKDLLDKPVLYVGVGEKIEDLQKFDAESFVNAIFD
jgi:fused signal recognition particle receptor